VSNYTQTLDLFATLCRQRGYQHLRLDGSTSITKRQKLVGQLNAPGSKVRTFDVCTTAGPLQLFWNDSSYICTRPLAPQTCLHVVILEIYLTQRAALILLKG
jgi:hypothetical protein